MLRWPREHGVWLLVIVLAVLLGVLAVLQYRWTGEIGRAEAERQRARLERASQRFARELGRELGQVMMAFGPEMRGGGSSDPKATLLQRLERWPDTAEAGLVSRLTLVTLDESGQPTAEAIEPGRHEFHEVPFPVQLEPLRSQLEGLEDGTSPRAGVRPNGLLADPPALLVPMIEAGAGRRRARLGPGAFHIVGMVLVELDERYLREVLFPELAEIHFGPLDQGDYTVAVRRRGQETTLYTSDPALGPGDLARPDVRMDLPSGPGGWLGSPRDRIERGLGPARRPPFGEPETRRQPGDGWRGHEESGPPGGPPMGGFGEGPPRAPLEGPEAPGPGGGGGSPWVLLVQHRGGSLAEAVDAVRLRNLAVGLGVLALLGTAAVLLAVGGQRARHLARQQLEFVAGVTHELHTPLAAIRSAGQNLKDGVVTDPAQVERYGDLIEREGGRLTALVAQVLDFAGIESGSRAYASEPVALGPLVERVTADLALVLEQAGMTVEVDAARDLPEIRGDTEALRRALENLLTNAVKFAREGGWIGIRATALRDGRAVELRVSDRGPGIARGERTRVFEPFYRGQDARQRQAPGSGLGLSFVRHVAEAHGGGVCVEAPAGGGTTVVMELPIDKTKETT